MKITNIQAIVLKLPEISSAADGTIRLWDVQTGRELHVYEDGMGEVRGVMFSPDGRRLLSGSDDKIIRIWPVPK